jgi:hypothetical protein
MKRYMTICRRVLLSKLSLAAAVGLLVGPSAARAQRAEPVGVGTWAFAYPADTARPGALLDLRFLNEKIAGESGFIKRSADGNGFVLGNGQPVRFWSVGTDIYRKSPDEMAKQARFLARIGVNMVRLHTQIAPDKDGPITAVNEKEIDGIWNCVAAMKKEGIYCTISPYWANGKKATEWGIDGYTGATDLWGVLFFNEKLQAGYKAWVKALYARTNPHTGLALAQDPAVALIQVQNEDGMFFWTMQGLHAPQKLALGRKFGQWLAQKYGSLAKAQAAWEGAHADQDDLTKGVVGIYDTWMFTQPQTGGTARRLDDQTQFFAETQRKFYADIADYYRKDLGCKQLINASNWITADPIRLNDLERWTYTAADVLAVNKYTGGVHTGENNGWRIDPGHHFTLNSCLLDPRTLPTNLKQVVGHPMLITESTWVSPEGCQTEGPFLMAAYQSLTGVDSLYWFDAGEATNYEADPYFNFLNLNGQHPLYKWTCATPTLMGSFPAAALMFRRGYVRQGTPAVHEERTLASMWQRQMPVIAEDKSFDPNRYTGNTVDRTTLQKGVDPLAFLIGPVEVKYGGDPAKSTAVDTTKYIDAEAKTVKSVTGEIQLDYGNGICTVDTPRAQGVTGFLKKKGLFTFADVSLRSANDYATLLVVPMDDKPIRESGKLLVQVGTYARPTGWQSKAADFKSDDGKETFHGFEIVNTGKMPWQISSTQMTLAVKNARLHKATLLDAAGYPVREIAGTRQGDSFALTLPPNTMYLLLE